MREVFAEQRLRGRTNAQPFGQGILSADRNPCAFGRKALDMVLFLLQQAFRNQHRHIYIFMTGSLKRASRIFWIFSQIA